jgi:hypothetical protein
MTPNDISHLVHEEIIMNELEPDVVRSRIQTMLADLPTDDATWAAS